MSYLDGRNKAQLVNPITNLPTEQLVANGVYGSRKFKDKSFLRCSIQNWKQFSKVADQQLCSHIVHFVARLMSEALDEVGSLDAIICHSEDDEFTIIDLATVISAIDKYLQQHFTLEALGREPVLVDGIRKLVGGDKTLASLRLSTKIITADEFVQIAKRRGHEAS